MKLWMGLCFLAAGWLGAATAEAVAPETWRISGVQGWKQTDRVGAGLGSDGSVSAVWSAEPVDGVPAFLIWDLLPDGSDLLVATGDGGRVYRLRNGSGEEIAQVVQPEVTALGRDGAGRVLAGAAPDGVIYRITGAGAEFLADTPGTYIWDILPAGREGAWIATGDPGHVYRWQGGKLSLLADLEAAHVTGLARRGASLLVTTDTPGRLVEVDAGGNVRILYDAAEPELRAPVVTDAGEVYFLANPEGNAPGRLYRAHAGGAVEPVWSALNGFVYDLIAETADRLWVSTGSDTGHASVVAVTPGPPSRWTEMISLAEPQALCLAAGARGGWVGTGGGRGVYRVSAPATGEPGSVVSPVRDGGAGVRWGALTVEPRSAAERVLVEVRSGNTREPGRDWSDWRRVSLSDGSGPVPPSGDRFLQWRLQLTDAQTEVTEVRVAYLPANRSPRVLDFQISPLGAAVARVQDRGLPASLQQELPGGVRVEFQVPGSRNGTAAEDAEAAWGRRYRTVSWTANDPNRDPLQYRLELRAGGESTWRSLAEDLTSSPWVWDSASVPDGWYQLRLTATDRPANPPQQALASERVGDEFLVDNTAPRVEGVRVNGGVLQGRATDEVSVIKRMEYAVDGGEWMTIFPEDGIPDSRTESWSQPLTSPGPGSHVVVVRVFDQAGNVAAGRASFTQP